METQKELITVVKRQLRLGVHGHLNAVHGRV